MKNVVNRGGHDGKSQLRDIWVSDDNGCTWGLVCENAPWPSRQGQATVVAGDSVYLMGGFGGSQRFNDLWMSEDMSKCNKRMFSWIFSQLLYI